MLVKKGDPLPQKWTAANCFGSSELTPRWERMNPINKIPDDVIIKLQGGNFVVEMSTGEIYKYSSKPEGLADAFNEISKHFTYQGYEVAVDKRAVKTRVYDYDSNGDEKWIY